jgi:hypothetical protein
VDEFYDRLLSILRLPALHSGRWILLECCTAWAGNGSHEKFIAFAWECPHAGSMLIAVNFAAHEGQARIRMPFASSAGAVYKLRDLLADKAYERSGAELSSEGLYVDLPGWGTHVFAVAAISMAPPSASSTAFHDNPPV